MYLQKINLKNKFALVTGAGKGLGRACAIALAEAGATIIAVSRTKSDLDRLEKSIKKIKGKTIKIQCDVMDFKQLKNELDKIKTIDILVNNAGTNFPEPFEKIRKESMNYLVDLNLKAAFNVAQLVVKKMLKNKKRPGSIINMSSVNGVNPGIGIGAYPASKAGIISMTQQMAIEWGKFGIRVNCISPGFIDAGMSKPIYEDPKVRELRGGAVPSGRLGEADDIANAVLFLDSENASYVNGHNLVVDGGVISSVIAQLPRE